MNRTLLSTTGLLAALCTPIYVHAAAATGLIRGQVLNASTKEYIRNASVKIKGSNISVLTESEGRFTINNAPVGPINLEVSYAGFETKETSVEVLPSGVTTCELIISGRYVDETDVITLGEFVVSSGKEGNAKALMEQKASLEAKKVIASDSFGSISEGNVGEFLKYLPGVMIDYTEADARSVSLGGLDPKYTSITIDGAPIASSGIAAASGTGGSRAFEFEQISINSIETVELSRTPQPENPGSAMAGVVNLRSKGAFDRKGRLITLNGGLAWNSFSGNPFRKQPGWDDEDHVRVQPNWGVGYSDVFLNKRLGVLAGYNYSYTFSEQKAELVAYSGMDTNPDNNNDEILNISSITFRDSPKPTVRYNTNLRLDYKFSPALWISVRGEYNNYHAKFFSRDLGFTFGPKLASTTGNEYSMSSQTTTPTGSSISVNQGGGGTNKYGNTSNYGFEAHFQNGAFKADFSANLSKSITRYKDRLFGFWWSVNPGALTGLGLRIERDGPADPAVTITQLSGPSYKDFNNYPKGFSGSTNDRRGEDQRGLLRLDTKYDTIIASIPTIIKTGAHLSAWENHVARPIAGYNSTRLGADGVAASADENLALWIEPSYRMNFGFGGNVDGLPNLDRWALYKDYQAHPSWWTSPSNARLRVYALQNTRDVKEQVDAIYNQTIFKIGQLTIAPGLRYERTRGSAIGVATQSDRQTNVLLGRAPTTAAVSNADIDDPTKEALAMAWVEAKFNSGRAFSKQNYGTWLRYLHTSYRFTEDLILKSSFNQSVSRPNMNDLIGGLRVTNEDPDNTTNNAATAGNADLKPEQTNTISVSLEYYTKRTGNITATAYRRDIKNLIRNVTFLDIPPGSEWNGMPLPTAISPNEPWNITTVDNVDKAHMSSLELSYNKELSFLPKPFDHLRVNTNYTRVKYDDYEKFLRPENMANLTWFLPVGRFRLSWNSSWTPGYRTEINKTIYYKANGQTIPVNPAASARAGWAAHNRERLTHTLDTSWEFRRNWTWYLTARNIFNQDAGTYLGRSDVRLRWVETGAIWTSGVRAAF